MNSDQLAGAAKRVGGKIEEAVGSVAGDVSGRVQGAAKQAEGAAQELFGQAKETVAQATSTVADAAQEAGKVVSEGASDLEKYVRDTIEQRPYTAVLVAFIAGCALASVLGGRRSYY
jgi:uncharacterized protein YjbJ (UPF0337 family)